MLATRLSDVDWFEWNNVRCTDYGVRVLAQPSIMRPKERYTSVTIPGHPGSLRITEGGEVYDNITLTCTCVVEDPYYVYEYRDRISLISKWLQGYGTVRFANRTGGYYKGRVANQISYDQIVAGNPHRSFQVIFDCDPFIYLDEGNINTYYPKDPNGYTIFNFGLITANPMISINEDLENPGDMVFEVLHTATGEKKTIYIYDFHDIAQHIVIDCEGRVAYTDGDALGNPLDYKLLMNNFIYGDWPIIYPGENVISCGGNCVGMAFIPHWRSL